MDLLRDIRQCHIWVCTYDILLNFQAKEPLSSPVECYLLLASIGNAGMSTYFGFLLRDKAIMFPVCLSIPPFSHASVSP
jgi:hypothetical protein